MSKFLADCRKELEAYVPGEQPQDRTYIKLNTHESPFPPSPGVARAVAQESSLLQLYSDPESRKLTEMDRIAAAAALFPAQQDAVAECFFGHGLLQISFQQGIACQMFQHHSFSKRSTLVTKTVAPPTVT